jgi:hypothetical protein
LKNEDVLLIIYCCLIIICSMYHWSFAIVNNKLAEVHFDKKKNGRIKIFGHCFVHRKEYKTKQEKKWIREDTKRMRFLYRNGRHKLLKLEK